MANGKYDPENPMSCHVCGGEGIEVDKVTADSPEAMKIFKSILKANGAVAEAEEKSDAILRKEFPCPACGGTGNHREELAVEVEEESDVEVVDFEPIKKKHGLRDWS
jgi:RecJ-like exonuclease